MCVWCVRTKPEELQQMEKQTVQASVLENGLALCSMYVSASLVNCCCWSCCCWCFPYSTFLQCSHPPHSIIYSVICVDWAYWITNWKCRSGEKIICVFVRHKLIINWLCLILYTICSTGSAVVPVVALAVVLAVGPAAAEIQKRRTVSKTSLYISVKGSHR